MASCLRLMLKCLAFIGLVLAFLFILDIFSLIFTIEADPNKNWKFIALLALIVSAFTLWGTDSKNPNVLAYAVDTSFITITLYYTIEMDDIIFEFSDLTGSALLKAIGLRVLVLLASTIIIAMIVGYQMTVQLEHVLLLRGQITSTDYENPRPRPAALPQTAPKSKPITSDTSKSIPPKSSGSKSNTSKSSPKVVRSYRSRDDESEGNLDDEEDDWDEDEEGQEDGKPSPSDVHRSAKSYNSQFLERPSSRISGSTANSSVTSKPSPTMNSGVPTKSSN